VCPAKNIGAGDAEDQHCDIEELSEDLPQIHSVALARSVLALGLGCFYSGLSRGL
jgi:hypothetical protein